MKYAMEGDVVVQKKRVTPANHQIQSTFQRPKTAAMPFLAIVRLTFPKSDAFDAPNRTANNVAACWPMRGSAVASVRGPRMASVKEESQSAKGPMPTTGSSSSGGSDGDGDADPWSAVNVNLEGDDVARFFEELAKETNRDPESTKKYLLQAIDARQKEDWSGAIYNYTMATTTRQGEPDKIAAPLNGGGGGSGDGDDDLVPAKVKSVQGRTAVFSAWLEGIQQDKRQAEIEAKLGAREADLRTIMLRFKVRRR
jgi:hypothetical protein